MKKIWLTGKNGIGKFALIDYVVWCKTKKEAAFAYNKLAKKYFGEFALLNKI